MFESAVRATCTLPDEASLGRLTSFGSLEASGWATTTLDWAEVIQADDNKAHIALQFSRYRSDGAHIVTFESLYILVRRDGQWRIQARSSFAPTAPQAPHSITSEPRRTRT
jgi:hypothetical protein